MGPRLFRRGNNAKMKEKRFVYTLLQWGHVFSDVGMKQTSNFRPAIKCFNGATSFQTWEFNSGWVTRGPKCAASMGPRLFRRGNIKEEIGRRRSTTASMGPRLFRRGNLIGDGVQDMITASFNGATSFQTWE